MHRLLVLAVLTVSAVATAVQSRAFAAGSVSYSPISISPAAI